MSGKKSKQKRSGNPAKSKPQHDELATSYALDLSWPGAVPATPAYSILAKVEVRPNRFRDYWVVMGLEHGFIGIPVGKEREADMSALPGILWGDVHALGSTQDFNEFSATTLVFEQIRDLMHRHEHGHNFESQVHDDHDGEPHAR